MSANESAASQLQKLSRPKGIPISAIPTKAHARGTVKNFKLTVNTGNAGQTELLTSNQTLGKRETAISSQPSNPIVKIKNKSTDKYLFQSEQKDYKVGTTLADAVSFLLCSLERVEEQSQSEDMAELLGGSSQGAFFSEFLETVKAFKGNKRASINKLIEVATSNQPDGMLKQLLSELSKSLQLCLHPAEEELKSLGRLASDFISQASSSKISEDDTPCTWLLLSLLGEDLGLGKDSVDKVKQSDSHQVTQKMDQLGFNSLFARQTYRLMQRDVHHNLLPGNGEDAVDSLVEGFTAAFVAQLTQAKKGSDISELIGQTTIINKLGTKFSRYDFTNNFTVGLLQFDVDLISSTSRKTFVFVLPNGKKIVHNCQHTLTGVCITSLRNSGDYVEDLTYPTVLDGVNQIQRKEAFAGSDFDWIGMNYNMYTKKFEWLAKDQSLNSKAYNHSKTNFFIGYDSTYNVTLEGLKSSVIVPLSNKRSDFIHTMRFDNINLFVSPNSDCTVDDLLKYLNACLKAQLLIAGDVTIKDLLFESLTSDTVLEPSAGTQKIKDLISQVGWSKEDQEQQACAYYCYFKIRHPMPDSESRASHLIVEENRFSSTQILKVSLSSYLQLMFREFMNTGLIKAGNSYCLAGQPLEYWMPTVLIIDLRKYSSTIVDAKHNIDLKELAKLAEEIGLSFNSKYMLRGLINSTKVVGGEDYYPVLVDTIKGTVVQYYDGATKNKLAFVRDIDIRYAFFERCAVDVIAE